MNEEYGFRGDREDICPFCCMDLFPIYSAGIESRERHVARHMENVALSILQQDDDIVTATEPSDLTQSDGQSIESWASSSSSSLGGSSDDGEMNDLVTSFFSSSHLSNREDDSASSSPERSTGTLKMDMTALTGGNDEMLSVSHLVY